eukprot:scaffold3256_cov114-Isochrysis_galbana.AAC.18
MNIPFETLVGPRRHTGVWPGVHFGGADSWSSASGTPTQRPAKPKGLRRAGADERTDRRRHMLARASHLALWVIFWRCGRLLARWRWARSRLNWHPDSVGLR